MQSQLREQPRTRGLNRSYALVDRRLRHIEINPAAQRVLGRRSATALLTAVRDTPGFRELTAVAARQSRSIPGILPIQDGPTLKVQISRKGPDMLLLEISPLGPGVASDTDDTETSRALPVIEDSFAASAEMATLLNTLGETHPDLIESGLLEELRALHRLMDVGCDVFALHLGQGISADHREPVSFRAALQDALEARSPGAGSGLAGTIEPILLGNPLLLQRFVLNLAAILVPDPRRGAVSVGWAETQSGDCLTIALAVERGASAADANSARALALLPLLAQRQGWETRVEGICAAETTVQITAPLYDAKTDAVA